ncbi:hypothetical protein NZ698_01170 [Chryseobacterium sp. PBS4-4]|uniref:Signal peptidase n=1 Tax=Chryseobacterium edaphi TaxID=2976532 RepID=A0ABT2W1I3_9FLAO|nr:hypothetical protein [Chryseobacterium edaphi]MCU7615794.1 hypothetical protein [Chryseobacterium edaphi]
MKKILITCSIVLSGFAFAQEKTDNPYLYNESADTSAGDTFPGNPGDPNAAPIDQYILLLALVGIAIAFNYGRRKKIA